MSEHVSPSISRRHFLRLAGIGATTALVAACAPAATPAPTAAPPAESEKPAAETATQAPAAEKAPEEIVDIKYTYAGIVPTDLAEVQDAMNAILEPTINTHLTLEPIDWGAFNDKITMRFAAGEQVDIAFTAPWTNSYVQNVANGNLHPLDDLLPAKAPGLWASMPESTWEAARAKGKIYAVINQQIFPKPWGVEVRKDMAEKYNLDLDAIKRWEDMEPFLKEVRDGEGITPEFWAQGTGGNTGDTYFMSQYWGIDPLDDAVGVVGIYADDDDLKVVLSPESPEYAQAMALTFKFVEDGIIPRDPLPAEEAKAAVRAGQYIYMHHVEKPGNEAELMSSYGHEWVIKNLTDPLILDTAGATATLNGIGASCPSPDNAMLVLEMLNTNVEVYTLICRGIEGKHWVWVDKEQNLAGFPEGVTGETSGYNPNSDWMFGNQFNAPYRDPVQVGAWPKTKEMNDTAMPSKALGFTFDRTPVQNEIAQITAVKAEYGQLINDGQVDPETAIPEYIDQLKAAGVQAIIDEMQNQLDAWKAG